MANHIHLYLIRANGAVIPFYNCSAAPTVVDLTIQSGDYRNEFQLDALQSDLAVLIDNGEGTNVLHNISPLKGGYRLKKDTNFTAAYGSSGNTNTRQLVEMSDLEPLMPDSMQGADLRQSPLQVTHWKFTVKFGSTTMEIPAQIVEGDAIAPAPPLGMTDDDAPEVAT
jgi:hypothetical protein